MFGFRKRKKRQSEEEHFLKLPLLDPNQLSPAIIADYINNGTPIVAVFDPKKDLTWSLDTMSRIQMNGLNPSVSIYRKEGPFLCNYRAYTSLGDGILHMVLYYIYEMKNSNIMFIYNEELKDASEIYHDDEHLIAKQEYYVHDFTEEEGLEFFKKNPNERCIYIGESRLVKKSDVEMEPEV